MLRASLASRDVERNGRPNSVTTAPSSQSFGSLLRLYRAQAAMSQEMLAERAGVSLRGLSDLERGRSRKPRLYTLNRLAEALALNADARARLLAAALPTAVDEPAPETAVVAASAGRAARRPLPGYLTGIIGRERDVAAIGDLLSQSEVRLLTLMGPGGVGKTRLAVQAAAAHARLFLDGV